MDSAFTPMNFQAMPEEARQLWTDGSYRRAALGDIVAAVTYENQRHRLAEAVAFVDRAVEVGLRHLGIPRGVIRLPIQMRERPPGRNAIKRSDCSLEISSTYFRMLPLWYSSLDPAFRTWLHESIHARQEYAAHWLAEFDLWEGYEEGLADGMAAALCEWSGAIILETTDYAPYVQAYRALAAVLQTSLWVLLRSLWDFPLGQVHGGFLDVVAGQYRQSTGQVLATDALEMVAGTADRLFKTGRTTMDQSDREVEELWRAAIR